jgi:competence protein ComEC
MRRQLLVTLVVLSVALAGCVGGGAGDGGETGTEVPEEADDGPDETDDAAGDDGDDATHGGDEESETTPDSSDDGTGPDDDTDSDGDADDEFDADDGEDGEAVDGSFEVHMIDVGQADATLIIGPGGETMLIDSGDWRQDGSQVIAYLEKEGVDRIDYLVATHGHADHIGGHAAVIEHFETEGEGIGQAWDSGVPHTSATYDRYLDAVEEYDVDLIDAQEGDEIPMEGVEVVVLNPPAESDRPDDLHYNSLSVHLTFGETSFLFTGDAEDDAEARMVDAHGGDLAADVYHAGHHGSSTSSTPPFLDSVDPEVALVSAAYESQYGHPHDEVLEAFADREIETYWTAVHGSVVVESDGSELVIETESEATTDPLAFSEETEASLTGPPVPTVGNEAEGVSPQTAEVSG